MWACLRLKLEANMPCGKISYQDCTTLTKREMRFGDYSRNPQLLPFSLLKPRRARVDTHMSGVQMNSFFTVATDTAIITVLALCLPVILHTIYSAACRKGNGLKEPT